MIIAIDDILSAEECLARCRNAPGCTVWTLDSINERCFLKDAMTAAKQVNADGMVSGWGGCGMLCAGSEVYWSEMCVALIMVCSWYVERFE